MLRWASAAVFLVFGLDKFFNHASELASFRSYGLPAPEVFVDVIAVIEIAGAVLLFLGLATRLAAALLACDMVGAILVSGIGRGETVSVTLAPALLVIMCLLVVTGCGRLGLDSRSQAGP